MKEYLDFEGLQQYHNSVKTVLDTKANNSDLSTLNAKVDNLELFKTPNVTIFGNPKIVNGQVSKFSESSYLQFPFVVDLRNKEFTLDFSFTPQVLKEEQQNIFDSDFGLAFAIRNNNEMVLALSDNGTSWLQEYTYRFPNAVNRTVYTKITKDINGIFKVEISVNKENWATVITTKAHPNAPYPKTITIGKSLDGQYPFIGIIDLNDAKLTVNNQVIWTGMDYVGLSTRLAVNLNNIDAEGKQKIKDITTFEATYRVTTHQEVLDAYNAGKTVIVRYGDYTYTLTVYEANTTGSFYFTSDSTAYHKCLILSASNAWGGTNFTAENNNNKISEMTAANITDTTKFPNCKAVNDFINSKEWYGTQAEFDALTEYQEGVNYYIYD